MSETDKKWMGLAKRWAVLFGIPLLILAMGIWQWSRSGTQVDVRATVAEYEQAIQELQAIKDASPRGRASVKDSQGRSIDVSLMLRRYETALKELKEGSLNVTTRNLQPTLAVCTIVLSVLALLWSALGVVYQRSMGKKALESREQLLATFQKGRKLLPTYMVVMVLLLFAAAIPLLVFEMMPILRHRNYSKGDMKFMLFLGGLAIFLFYSGGKVLWDVWKASRKPMENEPIDVMGQAITRQQAPELWAFVDRVASKTGAGMPDSIVVGLNEGFFVTEHPVKLSSGALVPQGRVLYLPLPYMAFLNAGEVAAVVGHELGHFIGEDTFYSQRFSPIYSATINHLVAIGGGEKHEDSWMDILRRPATLFGEMFLDSFHEAVRFWGRKRELAADAVGASVVNPQAVASSLLRITALEPHVNEALQANWDRGEAVEGGVLGHVRQLVASNGMVDPSEHLENRQSHPTDTHPELAARLDALGLSVTPDLLRRAMDPQGSRLLQEFGLERGAPAAAGRIMTGNVAPAPVVDISNSLQHELTGVAAANRTAKIDELTAIVRDTSQPVPVVERIWKSGLATLFFTLVFFGVGLSLLFKKGGSQMWSGIGMTAMGIGGLVWAYMLWRRSRTPAIVLTSEGMQLFALKEYLPWGAIDEFSFSEGSHALSIHMHLDQAVKAPALGVSKLRGNYEQKKHRLTVNLLGYGDKRAEKLVESIMGYWRAHHARQELLRMGIQS